MTWRHSVSPASRRRVPDAVGVACVLAAPLAILLLPMLHAPYVYRKGVFPDEFTFFIPMTQLAWTQVHGGHLPLWDPYNALGLPLAFDWQSAPFGVPALIGYVVPLSYAYTVSLLVTLFKAGSGAYVFCRVLGVNVLAATFAGVLYELSGPFLGSLGWPTAGVMAWAGWLFAASLLLLRGRRRIKAVTAFAIALACSIYAGHPEMEVQLLLALIIFVFVMMVARFASDRDGRAALRAIRDLALAATAGAALSAPVALPALQLSKLSVSNVKGLTAGIHGGLSPWDLVSTFTGSQYFGVIAISLVALTLATRLRESDVLALTAVAVICATIAFSSAVETLLNGVPGLPPLEWADAYLPMAFAVSVLAGMGLHTVVQSAWSRRSEIWRLAAVVAGAGGVVLAAWAVHGDPSQPSAGAWASAFATNLVWPLVGLAVGIVVALVLAVTSGARLHGGGAPRSPVGRRGRVAGIAFLICQTAFLVSAGSFWVSRAHPVVGQSYAAALRRAAGPSLVALGESDCFHRPLGAAPDVNVVPQLREFLAYDPMLPFAYDQSWLQASGQNLAHAANAFCPAVTTVAVARQYGINFVLEHPGVRGPAGSTLATVVGGDDLYRIPDSSEATLTGLTQPGSTQGGGTPLTEPVHVTHMSPTHWSLTVRGSSTRLLQLRLTDVPGWHASLDGRPLGTQRFDGIMLEARVPPGVHTIVLTYWPELFSVGVFLAAVSTGCLAIVLLVDRRNRRHSGASTPSGHPGPASHVPEPLA